MAAAQRRLARRPVTAAARPQPTLRSGADCLPQIEHIVILMMENHSYDNYFGMLTDRGDGFQLDESGLPTAVNKASNGEIVQMRRFEGTRQKGEYRPRPGTPPTSSGTTEPAKVSCGALSKPFPAGIPRWR